VSTPNGTERGEEPRCDGATTQHTTTRALRSLLLAFPPSLSIAMPRNDLPDFYNPKSPPEVFTLDIPALARAPVIEFVAPMDTAERRVQSLVSKYHAPYERRVDVPVDLMGACTLTYTHGKRRVSVLAFASPRELEYLVAANPSFFVPPNKKGLYARLDFATDVEVHWHSPREYRSLYTEVARMRPAPGRVLLNEAWIAATTGEDENDDSNDSPLDVMHHAIIAFEEQIGGPAALLELRPSTSPLYVQMLSQLRVPMMLVPSAWIPEHKFSMNIGQALAVACESDRMVASVYRGPRLLRACFELMLRHGGNGKPFYAAPATVLNVRFSHQTVIQAFARGFESEDASLKQFQAAVARAPRGDVMYRVSDFVRRSLPGPRIPAVQVPPAMLGAYQAQSVEARAADVNRAQVRNPDAPEEDDDAPSDEEDDAEDDDPSDDDEEEDDDPEDDAGDSSAESGSDAEDESGSDESSEPTDGDEDDESGDDDDDEAVVPPAVNGDGDAQAVGAPSAPDHVGAAIPAMDGAAAVAVVDDMIHATPPAASAGGARGGVASISSSPPLAARDSAAASASLVPDDVDADARASGPYPTGDCNRKRAFALSPPSEVSERKPRRLGERDDTR